MSGDKTYRYLAQAVMRPNGDYENVCIVEYDLETVRMMREWSRLCMGNSHRWIPLDGARGARGAEGAETQEKYMDDFFDM